MSGFNIHGLTDGIQELYRSRPELFGAETTQPISDAEKQRREDARRFAGNPSGGSLTERAKLGYTWSSDNAIGGLESFALNNYGDAQTGREQEGVLRGLANRVNAESDAADARERRARKVAVDEGTFERQTRGRGMSARQAKAAKRQLGLNRALSVADAGSASRRRTTDLAIGARKAAVNLEEGMFGQEMAGLSALANAEGQKRIRDAQNAAAKKSRKRGLLGAVVGAGLSLIPGVGPIIGPLAGAAISNSG